jgi:undecaprenyl-diphosphatase
MPSPHLSDIWRFVKRFEARVLIALGLASASVLSFVEIADDMSEGDTDALDRQIVLALRTPGDRNNPIGSHDIEEAVRDVTALGGTTLVIVVTLVGVLAFAFHRRYRHALVLATTVLLGTLSSSLTKAFFDRPRPDLVPHEVFVYSGSFPSGHSTMAATTYLTLAMLVSSLEPRRRTKALVYGLACAVLVGVGFSRVYLGVHWPSDVLAGWCLGAAWALTAWLALRLMKAPTRGV